MTNWVVSRLTLSGPHAEIMRFQKTCIREGDSDEECLDLGSLVSMPAVIVATLDDNSDAAKQTAADETGFQDWYDWRIARWGCESNTSNFWEIRVAPDVIDVSFETARSAPELALAALAAQFPLLSGRVCAMEEGKAWGVIGELHAGSYHSAFVEASVELKFLIYGWRLNDHVRLTTGLVLANLSVDGQGPSDDVLARIWAGLGAALAPELMARLSFEIDVHHLNQWHDADCETSDNDGRAYQLQDVIQIPLNLGFLSAEGRCHYPIDRKLMRLLSESLTAGWGRSLSATQIESNLRRNVAYILFEHSEEELLDWAFHASVRPKSVINFTDLASLQESFVRYAAAMREQILLHFKCLQEAMMMRRLEHVALGRAPDPLSSCITLS